MNGSGTSPVDSHALRLAESLRSRDTFQVVLECLIHNSICVSGLIGNLLVLYVVYKSARLRNVPGMFIASLALSDIAIISLATPPSSVAIIRGRWTAGFVVCQFQGFVVITTVAASLQTMALMSVDRYFRVAHPLKHRIFFTMPRARLMAASAWILAIIYQVPYLADGRKFVFHPEKMFCFYEAKSSFADFVVSILTSIVPVALVFCYVDVFRHLRLNANRVQNWRANDNARMISPEDAKLTRTLFATVLGYLICWTPVMIIYFVEKGVGEWSLPRGVYVTYYYIALTSSSLKPIIYGALNRTFQQQYKKIFCFKNSNH